MIAGLLGRRLSSAAHGPPPIRCETRLLAVRSFVLFQLVSRRYRKGSIILTSDKSFGEWGDIFSDHVLATAILDRLLHFSTTINIRGHSFRLRQKRKPGVFRDLTQDPQEVGTDP